MSGGHDLSHLVAIVGMAGRFPGAGSVEELWANLCRGLEAVTFFSDEELAAAGVDEEVFRHPRYVKARAVLDDVASFDAGLFGFSPREAQVMDPQLRLFLECAWEALESGGCDPARYPGSIGVFAGVSWNTYVLQNLLGHRKLLASVGPLMLRILNDKDFLTTWVSYRLGLRGPSVAVQTACSTSLVATHLACQSLLNFECDAALAGGVSVALPQREGYLYEEGSIFSPDGHCRSFDAAARGTVGGSGVGLVLLKRLADALEDGDPVHAVILGSAINNDGSLKVGYMAPSVDSQAEVIAAAQAVASVSPETIGYVEAHGTGTPMGDPIEVAALTRVFREQTARRSFCALGSLKSNMGHLDQAAGVAGLIKTALAVERGQIPPSLHFERPNPALELEGGPFYVNTTLADWRPEGDAPRRAGVSSFGVGGTNAHVVVEEPPVRPASGPSRPYQLLLLSARTEASLDGAARRLAAWLGPDGPNLADVAYTLQVGRREMPWRRMLVCRDAEDAAAALFDGTERAVSAQAGEGRRPVAFLFPGQGAQHAGMARGLYDSEPTFRRQVDESCGILEKHLGLDLRDLLFPASPGPEDDALLAETSLAQPALFVVEHALARLWMEWGVRPKAMIGHSVGEYVAACLAGVMGLEEALALVAARGRIVQRLSRGAMLGVRLPERELVPLLGTRLSLAAVNAPGLCVVSGPEEAVAALQHHLESRGVEGRRLHTSHAFHSSLMEPAMEELTREVRRFSLRPPEIPYLSNVTGDWIRAEEATDPGYWARHLRQTVRFSEGIGRLLEGFDGALLEVGPGRSLGTFVRAQGRQDGPPVVASMRHPRDTAAHDGERLLDALGRLWLAGVPVDWQGFYAHESRRKEVLPTYAFDRRRYWVDPVPVADAGEASLPELPAEEAPASQPPAEVLMDEVEREIAEAWREVLGVPEVGLHDDFFELGGHSLLATRAVTRLRERLGCDLPLDSLFTASTVARLAVLVKEVRPVAGEIPLRRREGEAVLSFGQQRLWFLHQVSPADAGYNMPFAVRLRGPLDRGALDRTLAEIFRRHEVLRTTFPATPEGRPQVVVAPPQPFTAPLTDLRHLPPLAREAELERAFRDEPRRPFDLARGPVVRARLFLVGEEDHVVLLTLHHIVSDGWSTSLLIRELTAIYPAFAAGEPSPLPDLAIQYSDYAAWQRERMRGEALEAELGYWRQQLAGGPVPLRLPADAQPGSGGGATRHPLAVPEELVRELAALARGREATLFMAALAAYQVLLHAVSGQEDVWVGTAVAGRTRTELEDLIGFFANTVVLRGRLEGNPTFTELLDRVRETTRGAYAHQEVPFDQVVAALREGRERENEPLYGAWLAFQNTPKAKLDLNGLTVAPVAVESAAARHDLYLSLWEEEGGLSGYFEHRTDLFQGSTVARWAEGFLLVLRAVAEDPEVRLPDLARKVRELDRGTSLAAVLDGSAGPAADFGTGCVHQLFEAHAARQPERTAVVAGDLSLTYAELDARAGALARRLRAAGVGPDKVVALGLEHGLDTIAGLLGTLKAGGAYLPLDPGLPAERRAFMLEDSGAVAVVTTGALASGLPVGKAEVILFDGLEDAPVADDPSPEPGNLVYVLYTSGSTGTPKAVQVEHRQLWNYVHAVGAVLGLPEGASYAMVSTFAADLGNTSLFPALCTGGTLHVVSQERAADAVALAEYFGRHPVDCLKIVPSHLQALLAAGPDTRLLPRRCLVVGGEASRWDWIDEIRSLVPGLRVVNHYGPTETTVGTAAFPFEEEGDRLSAVPPIGRPLANARIHLLDDRFEPVPCWVPAELYVAGAGVARGYLRRPALTAERFLPDPFAPEPGGRLYRTGDLARWLPDGNLEFLGRADDQVKIRGYRVELGEIAAALESHPSVGRAEVLARQDAAGQKRLVAYVATSRKEDLAPAFLRAFLRERLPEFMVPAVIVPLGFLPLTSNGKVDRRALPEPREEAPRKEGGTAPRTPAEEKLARVWKTVLRGGDVGVDDNFFALGGDSILGIQVVARARQEGLVLSPADLFRYQTLAELAQAAVTEAAPSAEPQGPVTGPVPLTPIQRRFFELDLAEPHHWNQALLLETRRPLERAAVAAAVESLVAHHDALRLRFTREEEGWSQVNGEPGGPVPLDWVDLSALPDGEARTAIEAVSALAQAGFDLSRGPLLRVVLFDLGPGRPGRLLLAAHHLVVDGVSWRVLLDDLGLAYAQAASGGSPELAPKTTSFKRWAERLREHAQSPEAAEELGFWLAQNERPVPPLPVDFSGDTPDTEGEAAHVRVALEPEATEALLRQVPEAYQSQVQEALLAALARAFGRFTGRFTGKNALRLELEGHGREDLFPGVDLSRTVGWFTARFPVTLDLAGAAGPGEALTAVKEQLRRVPRRGAGYGVLRHLRETADAEPLRREPTPEISFNYLGQLDQIVTEDSLFGPARESSGPVRSPAARRTHLLQIDASVENGRLQATWGYSPRRHRRETIEALAAGFLAELRSLIDHCRSSEAGGYTPSDFPDLELSQLDLDSILDQVVSP